MNPRSNPLRSRRRFWALGLGAVALAAVAVWFLTPDRGSSGPRRSLNPKSFAFAQEKGEPGGTASTPSRRVDILYTVNNLGYTATCG